VHALRLPASTAGRGCGGSTAGRCFPHSLMLQSGFSVCTARLVPQSANGPCGVVCTRPAGTTLAWSGQRSCALREEAFLLGLSQSTCQALATIEVCACGPSRAMVTRPGCHNFEGNSLLQLTCVRTQTFEQRYAVDHLFSGRAALHNWCHKAGIPFLPEVARV
jgi:hypothetical protein